VSVALASAPKLLVVAESAADARFVRSVLFKYLTGLIDCWSADSEPDEEHYAHADVQLASFTWAGNESAEYLDVHGLDELHKHHVRRKRFGNFGGAARQPDELQFLKLFDLVQRLSENNGPCVILVARDTDNDMRRCDGLTSAAARFDGLQLVRAWAHTKIEAWKLLGAQSSAENLNAVKAEIGFDPREQPHRLTPADENAPKNAKRVYSALGSSTTLDEPWSRIDWSELRQRGKDCLFADFLDDVDAVVCPLLGHAGS
jgi:hypothetical protein